jgi:hypothetical protein
LRPARLLLRWFAAAAEEEGMADGVDDPGPQGKDRGPDSKRLFDSAI